MSDPDSGWGELVEGWERSAAGWGRQADRFRAVAMPVSTWMIQHMALAPGQRVLELAAGPGDTGFLAAEAIAPGGTLVCSDGAEGMLEVARGRATRLGIENVEFQRLELEWIDLPTASVDAIVCRWGFMLSADPAAAFQEARRVLKPGGRVALAVWDAAERNPWATIPRAALLTLGHTSPADPSGPGMFALAAPGRLREMLAGAGFLDMLVEGVELDRDYPGLEDYLGETRDLARSFAEAWEGLTDEQRAEVRRTIASLAEPFTAADGSLRLPGRTLVAGASA
ncbi:MAG: class I SAM-dependent methyltransferase [Solirubrobacteraceae bacterium]